MYSVLVVDDEPIIRKGIIALLATLPDITHIKEAGNGIEALDALKEHYFDIIITDIKMPRMDGLTLCEKIKKRCPQISIVILSGYDDFSYAQTAIKHGVKNYILKPVTEKKLNETFKLISQNIEKKKSYLYIPYQDMTTILRSLEEGIWHQTNQISGGITLLLKATSKLSIEHTSITCRHILDQLINRLSLKLGYSVSILPSSQTQSSKMAVYSWFEQELENVRKAFDGRLAKADYNIIEMSKDYIKDNYSSDMSLEDIARSINLNPTYFSTLFKQKTGQTFVQYRTDIRLSEAKERLLLTDMSITEIGSTTGFNDTTHFTRTFKKHIGITPSQYRKQERSAT